MAKYKNVYVIGVFDLFHRGHVELLRKSKELGERLIVAINGDDMVASYKRRPFTSETDRLAVIEAIKYVDEAFVIKDYDNKEFIKKHQIDAIVHGDDWEEESYMKQICVTREFLDENGVSLILVGYTKGISTSELISNIRGASK